MNGASATEAGRWWSGRRKRRWALAAGAILLLLMGMAAGFSGCMQLRMSEAQIRSRFAEAGLPPPEYFDHESTEGRLRVAMAGNPSGPTIVFAHGSPGSWDAFIGFLANPRWGRGYRLLAVDRPGFGAASPAVAEPSLEAQARRIHAAVAASGARLPAIWVGHSLGGPVIVRLAVDYPEAVSGLVLVAPSMDPELERRRLYNYLAKLPPIRWALSPEWRNSNDEIFPHREELELLAGRLGEIAAPTIVVQGDSDRLVPPANADYVERAFGSAAVSVRMLEGVDHFIPWSRPEAIEGAIEDLAAEGLDRL